MYDISVFAERLIAERKKKKLTQSELAEKAKISAQTVSYYEKGTKRPTLENAIAIANALDISIEYLCGQDASRPGEAISTVADLVWRITELSQYYGEIRIEAYTDEVPIGFADEAQWQTVDRKTVSVSFRDVEQPEMVRFFENRKTMLGLLHNSTLDETIYNSWLNGETQKLEKIPADNLPFLDEADKNAYFG